MTKYRIQWDDCTADSTHDTIESAEAVLDEAGLFYGHDGDLRDGGSETFIWDSAAKAGNSDGRGSIAEIVAIDS